MKTFVLALFLPFVFSAQIQWAKKLSLPWYGAIQVAKSNSQYFYINALRHLPGYKTERVIIKIDTSGNVIKQVTFPQALQLGQIVANSKNQLFVAGGFSDSLLLSDTSLYSKGSVDCVLLSLDSDLNLKWAKTFGDTLFDGFNAIVCDNLDRLFVTGMFCENIDIQGNKFMGNKTGTSFVLRLNQNGEFEKLVKDSTNDQTKYKPYAYLQGISINDNNELLIGGSFDSQLFYFLGLHQMNVPPLSPSGYDYGYTFGIKLDSDLNIKWSKCTKLPKFETEYFVGHTTQEAFMLNHSGYPYGRNTEVRLVNDSSKVFKTITYNPHGGYQGMAFAGVCDDNGYFFNDEEYYDENGTYYPLALLVLKNGQFHVVDTMSRAPLRGPQMLKGPAYDYYLFGLGTHITIKGEKFESDTVRVIMAKLGPETKEVGLPENERYQPALKVYPNPTHDIVQIEILDDLEPVFDVDLLNSTGVLLNVHRKQTENGVEIDLSSVRTGMYFLRYRTSTTSTTVKVFKD